MACIFTINDVHVSTCVIKVTNQTKLVKYILEGDLAGIKRFHELQPHTHWVHFRFAGTSNTFLHIAASLNDEYILEYLLTKYEPKFVDCRNMQMQTPLHTAAQCNADVSSLVLIKHGADVDAKDTCQWTPLMCSIAEKGYKVMKLLLENGADVNICNNEKTTPLHLVAEHGDFASFKLLQGYRPSLDVKNHLGCSPLHVAIYADRLEMAEELIDIGADLNIKDNRGFSPLHDAVFIKNHYLFYLLMHAGSDVYAKDNSGYSILHCAAEVGTIDIVKVLISLFKYDVNQTTEQGLNALHFATSSAM